MGSWKVCVWEEGGRRGEAESGEGEGDGERGRSDLERVAS